MPLTEAEWLASTEPTDLLRHLGDRAGARKLRLFACACCQHIRPLLSRPAVLSALDVAARFADGLASREDLRAGWMAVRKALGSAPLGTKWEDALMGVLHATSDPISPLSAHLVSESVAKALDSDWRDRAQQTAARAGGTAGQIDMHRQARGSPTERALQARLLRDLFSYQPRTIDPAWRRWQHGQLVSLALSIYEENRFQDLPVLADALEEAGCMDQELLGHCRQTAAKEHVRGCWAVDLVLGKPE